jgi:hypothetical protein
MKAEEESFFASLPECKEFFRKSNQIHQKILKLFIL